MMSGHRISLALFATVTMTTLTACDGGFVTGGDGARVDAQIIHPASIILEVLSVKSDGEHTLVNIRALNGRDGEIELDPGTERSYILLDSGEKLMLAEPATNPDLAIPPGKSLDGALVFIGKLPSSGKATLILNASGSRDGQYTASPKFEVDLPLEGTSGGSVPETSTMSNMNNLPRSTFGPATASGSTFGSAGSEKSNLQAVEKLKSDLGAVETDRGTVISLPGDVTFDFDKATLRAEGRATLDRLAELIAAGGAGKISIEGHTDAKGDDAYNKRLSEQRAAAVKTYLTEKGVAGDRLTTIGLGELRPVAPNAKSDGSDDEDGRQKNRRVEVILPKEAGGEPAAPPQ